MTPSDLRKLNQFRTFARGFDKLQAGDEIDVPTSPQPDVVWDNGTTSSADSQNDPEKKMASFASQTGSFLSSRPKGEAVASAARGMASSAANNPLEQWMSGRGTARVQLNADDNFSLKTHN